VQGEAKARAQQGERTGDKSRRGKSQKRGLGSRGEKRETESETISDNVHKM
jgi:hypothetical protein